MDIALNIITVIVGVLALVISVIGLNHNKIEAINAFFENDRNETLLKAREIVHNLKEGYDPVELLKTHGNEIAYLIISYNQAAVLVKQRQLPYWVFSKQASSGYAVIRIWEKLEPYINMRRNGYGNPSDDIYIYPNPSLAIPFQNLYKRISASYNK